MATPRNTNLNLLPVLHALLHHQSVTRAGEELHMSQSAVSDALANLRRVFGDQLLVKSGRKMVLTDYAKSLLPQIDETINNVQQLLGQSGFEPSEVNRRFVVVSADSVIMTIGPKIAAALESHAPKASIQFENLDPVSPGRMSSGVIDVTMIPQEVAPRFGRLHEQELYREEFVCIMRKGHPLARGTLSKKSYLNAVHARFWPGGEAAATHESRILEKEHATQVDAVRLPQFSLLPYFVETTDRLAMVPRRVAERMKQHSNIHIARLPFRNETVISMYWNNIKHNDPVHRWFRSLIADLTIDDRPTGLLS